MVYIDIGSFFTDRRKFWRTFDFETAIIPIIKDGKNILKMNKEVGMLRPKKELIQVE